MKTSDIVKTKQVSYDISEMARPDFPAMGLGKVAYIRQGFKKFQFVYNLIAADGSILLRDASLDTVQSFVFENDLEIVTIQ